MKNLGISIGMLATVLCLSVRAQTVNIMALDQDGAQTILQAAKESAQQRNAPSAIAVVDPAGCLLSSGWMAFAQQVRTSRSRRHERLRGYSGRRRTAFVTAGILVLRGGMPIRVNGAVVGAVGVAGLSKETDAEIANAAAAALSPSPMTAQRR